MELRDRLAAWRRLAPAAVKRTTGRLRRRPVSAKVLPRPRRPAHGRTLQLTHALVASDLNPSYLDFWPLVQRAWREVVGVEPVLVLVADPGAIPEPFRDDPGVRVFPPLDGVHTALQAQCIRLLYPALVETDGAVLISDADMVPLSHRFFHRPARAVPETDFVAYRDAHLTSREIPICYNAALPQTWGAVFGVEAIDDVGKRLAGWAVGVEYDGVRGGAGWLTDQQILYRTLTEHGRVHRTVWILDDGYTGFRRLERSPVRRRGDLDNKERRLIRRGAYSDFHCVHTYAENRDVNDAVVDAAIEAARGRRAAGAFHSASAT